MTLKSEDLLFERRNNGKLEILRKEYYSVDCPDFVTCVVIKDDKILVIKQYRHPIRGINVEFVAGMIDKGEEPYETAIKELREEAGIIPNNLVYLGKCKPVSGQNTNMCYVYLVSDFSETESELEPYESFTGLIRSWIPISEFKKKIKSGEFNDGVTLMAWCLFLESQFKK
jgi:ADP-ribose pyrophosphatase